MASIKGIALQNYQDWETPRGVAYRAELLVDGEKVGELYHEGMGGCPNAHVKNTVSQELSKRIAQYFQEHPSAYETEESFWEELLQLGEWQTIYQKQKEKGKHVLVVAHKHSRLDENLITDIDELQPSFYALPDTKLLPHLLQTKKIYERDVFESEEDFDIFPVVEKRIKPESFDNETLTVADMIDEKEYVIKGEETVQYVTLQKKKDTVLVTFTFEECIDDQTVVYPLSAVPMVEEFQLEVYVDKKPEQDYTLTDLYLTALSLYDGYIDHNFTFPEQVEAKIKVYQKGELV